jgi:hypothetical protein
MKTKRQTIFAAGLLAATAGFGANAPEHSSMPPGEYAEVVRSDLKAGTARLYEEYLKLTDWEAKIFWPAYREFETALFKLSDQRTEVVRQILRLQQSGTFDEAAARPLAQRWFELQEARLKLLRKYHDQFAKELSPVRAVQFVQIEHDIALVVDLGLAAEQPLFGTAMPVVAPAR